MTPAETAIAEGLSEAQRCQTCRFAKPWPAGGFHCRRMPPQLVAFSNLNGDVGVENHWPFVDATDWCGEHSPIPVPDPPCEHGLDYMECTKCAPF